MTAKYPRRLIALGPPYDDGTYFTADGKRASIFSDDVRRHDAVVALIADIRHRLAILAGPGVVGLPKEKEWRTALGEMQDDLQIVLDAIEDGIAAKVTP